MLAFDRERLRLLGASIRTTLGEIARVSSDDPLAWEAMTRVSRVQASLRDWIDLVRDVAESRVMDAYTPIAGGAGDRLSLDAWVLGQGLGWSVVDDSCSLGTPAHVADETVVAAAAHLDDSTLLKLLEGLRTERSLHLQGTLSGWGDGAAGVAQIDRAIQLIATALEPIDAHVEQLLGQMAPESAALVLAAIDTDAETFARLAVEILARWLHRPSGTSDDSAWPLDSPADHLLAVAGEDFAMSTALFLAMLDHPDGLHLLTDTAVDPSVATQVVLTASDPALATVVEAGSIVRPYVTFVLDEMGTPGVPYDNGYRDLLGAVVGPWLPQMTSRAGDWGWTSTEAVAALTTIASDSTAFASLLDSRGGWLSTTDMDLHDLSEMMGWFDAIAEDMEVEDELAERFLWDLGWSLIDKVVELGLTAIGASGIVESGLNAAASQSRDPLRELAERNGWLGAPRLVTVVVGDAAHRHDVRRTTLAAVTALAAVDRLKASGLIPRNVPAPPPPPDDEECASLEWRHRFDDWLTGIDEPHRSAIDLAASTMLNGYQAAEACQD